MRNINNYFSNSYFCLMSKKVENTVYLLIGGNLGHRENYLEKAIGLIKERAGKIVVASSVYETEPWGVKNQPSFLNQALRLNSYLSPEDMLEQIKDIERVTGRTYSQKWYQREIDIDILLYNDYIIKKDSLVIPHPSFHERRFALVPLNEIASEVVHPQFGKTIIELLKCCNDPLEVALA